MAYAPALRQEQRMEVHVVALEHRRRLRQLYRELDCELARLIALCDDANRAETGTAA